VIPDLVPLLKMGAWSRAVNSTSQGIFAAHDFDFCFAVMVAHGVQPVFSPGTAAF
jgi:hypothetical protein